MAGKVTHFEILGKDADKLRSFYSKLFDWKFQVMEEMNYGLVQADGEGSIGGGVGAAQDGMSGHATFYVEVDDVQAHLDKVESLGGKTVVPPIEIPDMVTYALFTDPDGNLVGLAKSA